MAWPEVTPRVEMGPMFDDDEIIEGQCDLENPETCESCQ